MNTISTISSTSSPVDLVPGSMASRAQQNSVDASSMQQAKTPTLVEIGTPMPDSASREHVFDWVEKSGVDKEKANTTFQSLTDNYNALMSKIATERLDIASQKFDFVTTASGTLQVTSDTLSSTDKAWLQKILNSDSALVADAKSFNASLVNAYSNDVHGTLLDGQAYVTQFQQNLHTSYNYQGLGNSINGSVKFVSLMNDVANYWATQEAVPQLDPGTLVVADPFSVVANLAQNYLQANIKQYVQSADGSYQAVERKGIIMSVFA